MSPGRLIAFEGGEGAGKTTQIKLLAEFLARKNRPVVTTREPGGTPEGLELRRLLLTDAGNSWSALSETMLMVVDRVQHLDRVVYPAVEAGNIVITDRFVFSTLAYQGAGRGVPEAFIRDLHRTSCGDYWPDLTIILDIDPAAGLARSKRRLTLDASAEDRFEALNLDFHARVRAAFLKMADEDDRTNALGQFLVIDAAQSIDAIQQRVRDAVSGLIAEPT